MMDIEQKIDELQELVSQYDTESFAGYFAYFIKKRPEPFAEIDLNKFESKLKDFLYLIALNAFSEKRGTEKFQIPFDGLGILADKLNEIKNFNRVEKWTDYTTESVIHELAFRNHFDNGVLSYVEQDLERLKNVFAPFNDRIVQVFGFGIDFLIDVCKEIELISIIRTKYLTEFSHSQSFAEFQKRIEKKEMSFSESFDLLPEDVQATFHSFHSKPYATLMFTAEDLYHNLKKESVDKFLSLFSIEALFNPNVKYYSAESPFELTPLLKLSEGNYLSLYGKQIPVSIYKRLFIELTKDEKLEKKLLKHREKSLERKVVELFKYFFPSKDTFFYENYFLEKNFEQDLLIICRGAAIIIETKASKLREPFRDVKKAITRLKDDFKASIQYGFEQCLRVEDYFFNDTPFEIKDEKNKILFTVTPKKIHSVFSIVVTLERFGSLQTDLKLMLNKEEDVDYPWSVYIDDLEIFLLALNQNVKGSTSQFLNFLNLRRKIHGRMYAIDELDICASYLQNPEKFRQYSKLNRTFINFSPYEQGDFDRLYRANQLRFKEKPLPDDFYI